MLQEKWPLFLKNLVKLVKPINIVMEQNLMKSVYLNYSHRCSYFHSQISSFVLREGFVPLDPFMLDRLDQDTLDPDDPFSVDRNVIRHAKKTLLTMADELRVFGPLTSDVRNKIKIAREQSKPMRYYRIVKSEYIMRIED